MDSKDLTTVQLNLIYRLNKNPRHKYIADARAELNILSAYGLVRDAGNLQYELTSAGEDIVKEFKFVNLTFNI